MSTECLLHAWHRLDIVDTETTRVTVSVLWMWLSVGKTWMWQGWSVKEVLLLCVLGVCGVQLPASPGGTELRAAFPGKMFMFQNFPSWLLPLLNGLMSHCLQVLLAVYLDAGSSQSIGEHRYIKRVILSFYPFYKHIL